jgi:chromosome segregation ATPase
MKRKVDTIQKQVANYKEKDHSLNKELASLNTDLVRYKDISDHQLTKNQQLQSKFNVLNNDFISLKNKCAILEKTVDNKGDKYVEKIKDVMDKVRRSSAYA